MDMGLLERFREANNDGLPGFDYYDKPLEMGLWVLWIAKEKLNIRMLTAYQIADVIVSIMEVSVRPRAIINAFNKAEGKIHIHYKKGEKIYEIMKAGKEHLITSAGGGSVKIHYFEPEKRYSSKRILREHILDNIEGDIRIVDPYCDSGTLDILSRNQKKIECLTRLENLRPNIKQRFLRDLKIFKSEYPDVEFRNYSKSEIHDRYIISNDKLIILGYSLKDLGAKESFAVVLDKKTSRDVYDVLTQNFNRRWKAASQI